MRRSIRHGLCVSAPVRVARPSALPAPEDALTRYQSQGNEPAEYLAERVRQALVEDPRAAELDVQVELVNAAETVVLTGCVATPERRRAIEEVAREVLPDRRIDNRTVVGNYPESDQTEHLS